MDAAPSYLSQGTAFRSGAASPLTLAQHAINRIKGEDTELRAFVCLDEGATLEQARQSEHRWRAGQPLSRLDGALLAVKDIIETADFPTGQGTAHWSGFKSRRDAATVLALRQAGAIVIGKTTTTEYALTELLASTTNPKDAQRTPGGSSSGSAAAVGAGLVPLALGSQVVGSTLRPASYCGCYGLKPSVGALNRGGAYDYFSQSSVGLFAGSLEDLWEAACEIARRVGGDPGFAGLETTEQLPDGVQPRRLAILETAGWPQLSRGAKQSFEAQIAALRAAGVDVKGRENDVRLDAFEQLIDDAMALTWEIMSWEMRWPIGTDAQQYAYTISRPVLGWLAKGKSMTRAQYAKAIGRRAQLREQAAELLQHYDGFISLAATGAAPIGFQNTGDPSMNVAISLLGLPAISLPTLQDNGLPLGLQLVTAIDRDVELMSLSRWMLGLGSHSSH